MHTSVRPHRACHLDQGIEVGIVGMDPAVGKEPHQVKLTAPFLRPGQGVGQDGVREEIAIIDAFSDPGQILIDDPSGAEVEMADFRISHLALGQPDIHSRGPDAGRMG